MTRSEPTPVTPESATPAPATETPVVNSHNEWDLLEEVIVGHVENAMVPPWDVNIRATTPEPSWKFIRENSSQPFPKEIIDQARRELEEFVHILEAEGVTVRRPDVVDFSRPYATQDWRSEAGLYAAMPRDVLLVFGDELIEVPMSWRCRYHEITAYRTLLKEYFHGGARWTAAPRPELKDELFDQDYQDPEPGGEMRYVINEFEPTFDAADFVKCGRDIFAQKSNVTNDFGIEWLRRHLGEDYRIHVLEFNDDHPMHIDATFMPLAPGKLLVNPARVEHVPDLFKNWDILEAPPPCPDSDRRYHMCSEWISVNVFMLDSERVVVESCEEPMIKAFKDWGFETIPCSLRTFNVFGGGFHCTTLDVRRRSVLESYF